MTTSTRPERISGTTPQTWYFTFGLGGPNGTRFYKVEDATFDEARARMVATFGTAWAFQYDAHDWFKYDGASQADKWHLTELH